MSRDRTQFSADWNTTMHRLLSGTARTRNRLVKLIQISLDINGERFVTKSFLKKWYDYISEKKKYFICNVNLFSESNSLQFLVTFNGDYLAELPSCIVCSWWCSLLCKLIQVLKHHHFIPDLEVKEFSSTFLKFNS